MEPKISVTIPIGPKPSHKQWLKECIDSVMSQTVLPAELILIDDKANINLRDYFGANIVTYPVHLDATVSHDYIIYEDFTFDNGVIVSKFNNPWLGGVVVGFNFGVMLAKTEWVLQLGSDDTLAPQAIQKAVEEINSVGDDMGMYNFYCKVSDGQLTHWPNHANVMSKKLFQYVGGYHPMTSTGGMDAAFNSILLKHMPEHIHMIGDGTPYYFVKDHAGNYTKESASRYGTFMDLLRNDLTRDWTPNV